MNKKVRLADFMNVLDENFQIIMGIIFVDEDGTYYCTKDYIHKAKLCCQILQSLLMGLCIMKVIKQSGLLE